MTASKDDADQVREILAQAVAAAKLDKMEEQSILKVGRSYQRVGWLGFLFSFHV